MLIIFTMIKISFAGKQVNPLPMNILHSNYISSQIVYESAQRTYQHLLNYLTLKTPTIYIPINYNTLPENIDKNIILMQVIIIAKNIDCQRKELFTPENNNLLNGNHYLPK